MVNKLQTENIYKWYFDTTLNFTSTKTNHPYAKPYRYKDSAVMKHIINKIYFCKTIFLFSGKVCQAIENPHKSICLFNTCIVERKPYANSHGQMFSLTCENKTYLNVSIVNNILRLFMDIRGRRCIFALILSIQVYIVVFFY